jgi:hypothetical protein
MKIAITNQQDPDLLDEYDFSQEVRGKYAQRDRIKLFDSVTLASDLPEYNLRRGQVGTVVEILAEGKAFEVEFSDRDGRTYESIGLRPDQIMVLHYEPIKTEPISAVE